MSEKKSPTKKRTKKPSVPVVEKEKVKVTYVCRNCHCRKSSMIEIDWCITSIGIKAQRCHKCKKWGTYLASMTIDEKEIYWAVISYAFIKGKKVVIDESTNDNFRIKKKLYGNLKKKELDQMTPFHGICHHKNRGLTGEEMVDADLKPKPPKWSAAFKRKYNSILDSK